MRYLIILFSLSLVFSCSTRNIKYNRKKIIKKYSNEYMFLVDKQKMDLKYTYLDKDNIENVQIDKKSKEIKITQYNQVELFEMKNLKLDSFTERTNSWNKNNLEFVIIDGIVKVDSVLKKIKIDTNAIKSFTRINKSDLNKMNFCRAFRGDAYLIITK